MLRKSIVLSCFVALTGISHARADTPSPVTGDSLKQMVPGSSIAIDTPLSTVVPIHFTPDGLMTGEAGALASVLGAERDRGRWWVTGDRLCLKWFRWFDAEQRCLALRQDGDHVFWEDDEGKTGTATVTKRGEQVAAKSAPEPVVAKPAATPATPPVPAPAPVVAAAAPASAVAPPAAPAMASTDFGTLSIISRAEAATPPAAPPDDDAAVAAEPAPAAKPHNSKSTARKAPPANKPHVKRNDTKTAALAAKQPPKIPADKSAAASKARESLYQVAGVEEDDVLNIRNGPSEYHDAIGAIPPTARGVKIVGNCEADWCPVAHGKTKGWVNRYYLAPEAARDNRTTARASP